MWRGKPPKAQSSIKLKKLTTWCTFHEINRGCDGVQLQYRLSATGVSGSLEITRVDWDQYKLKYKLKGDRRSTSRLFRVAGVQNEFQSFLNLVGDWRSGAPAQDRKPDTPPAAPATPSPAKRRNRFDEEPAPAPAHTVASPSTTTTTTHHTTEAVSYTHLTLPTILLV